MSELSERQKQVLKQLAKGHSSKEIGRELGISHETVRKHLAGIRGALGVRRAAEMAAYWSSLKMEEQSTKGSLVDSPKCLTHREHEVAQLLSKGFSIKQVSLTLNMAPGTAAKHRENLLGKLGARKTSLLPLLMKDFVAQIE